MRGSLVHRGKNRWAVVLDLGFVVDPVTGKKRRRQKWISVKGNRDQADKKLTELVAAKDGGTFVEPSKVTLLEYLRTWLDRSVKPPMRRPETYRVYRSFIEGHIAKASIATVPLQQLRGSDVERFYADLTLAASSITVLHALLHRALRKAVKDRLLTVNPAVDLERRKPEKDAAVDHAQRHCWTATEARAVLREAERTATPQMAAFVYLALDSGARKSELAGLTWADVDLDAGTVRIARQLDTAGMEPVWGPTKTKCRRTVTLGAETIVKLRAHKRAQSALKMKNRTTYKDFDLMFAKEPEDLQRSKAALGQPLDRLSEGRFQALVKAAGVRRIKFHGCRHTCATLSLQAGTPPHVVAERLGHSVVELLTTYAHVVPGMQRDAADRLGAVLHG
jgi:integrase